MAEPETLLTTAEAANVLNVSPQTISRWVSIGRLQPIRKLPGLRGAFLFSPDDVAALCEAEWSHDGERRPTVGLPAPPAG